MSEVRDILREVRLTIGDEGDSGDRERQQARVKRMLVAMGVSEEDLDNELKEYKRDQEVGVVYNAPASCSIAIALWPALLHATHLH